MPFKNTEDFLPDCLDSIKTQGYKSWELLAVDDHSTDTSRQILERYATGDSRIKFVSNTGKGIIPALRKSHGLSQGKLVTRMDSDDLMSPGKLGYMVEQLRSEGPGNIALGQVRYFSDRGISDGYAKYEAWLNRLTATGNNFDEIYKECVIPSPSWMVHREDLEACGAFEPSRYPEDYDLCFRFYEAGMKCLPTSRILHHWRDYEHRTSRTSVHYAQNYFLDLKLHYFLKLNRDPQRPLLVWGAGFKGKNIAKNLKKAGQFFYWICDNPNKIGKNIYEIPLRHFSFLESLDSPQSIITVANAQAQKEIREYLKKKGQRPMHDYYFFC